ncbi:hypothetical protein SAMN05444000_10359 [Shimia gijangensis]|uniref:PsiF repeat-containing protein n=1 Tax=Shimia gijangensis TaxID=1470563 RepID=A0A1M6DZS9_9RHOB|nr:hypothetical protein [Shimia gijangensis]SHI78645.1 hypothetical protein SAMN05444000_10359 [Shimia gijangensis]
MRNHLILLTTTLFCLNATSSASETLGKTGNSSWESLNQRYGANQSDQKQMDRLGITNADFSKCKSGDGARRPQQGQPQASMQGAPSDGPVAKPSGQRNGDKLYKCLKRANPYLSRGTFEAVMKSMRSQF